MVVVIVFVVVIIVVVVVVAGFWLIFWYILTLFDAKSPILDLLGKVFLRKA